MRIQIKTLSPIYIGGDQADKLSPYSDYIWQDGQFFYIDSSKLEKYLTPEMVDEWVDGIRAGISNTQSTFSLADFLKKHKIPLEKIIKNKTDLETEPQRKNISRFIHSGGRPFIPGSSIKGAIRTAFVYQLLLQTNKGNKFINDFVSYMQKKSLDKKEIRNQFIDKLVMLLDKTSYTDPFKNFIISDSQFFSTDNLQIAPVARYHMKKLSEDSPSWREVIREGSETEFSLKLKNKDNESDPFWKSLNDWREICRYLNEFSKKALDYEISSLENPFFSRISDFYKNLKSTIDKLNDTEAILRIGAGKTFFDNTIDLLFEQFSDEFYRFRVLFGIGRNPKGNKSQKLPKTFPVSRFFIGTNKKPIGAMGWIKLSREKSL